MIQSFFAVVGSKPYPLLAKYHRDRGNTKREGKREILSLCCLTGDMKVEPMTAKEIYVFMTVLVPCDSTISYSVVNV
jgi:hypothetical protein